MLICCLPAIKLCITHHVLDITCAAIGLQYTQCNQRNQLVPQKLISLINAGPRANPETRSVAELAHAMWFDRQEDTLEFLLKAGLEPEQSGTGAWQLVLHRSLKVDPQAASFRQRSARICNQQAATRCPSVSPAFTGSCFLLNLYACNLCPALPAFVALSLLALVRLEVQGTQLQGAAVQQVEATRSRVISVGVVCCRDCI